MRASPSAIGLCAALASVASCRQSQDLGSAGDASLADTSAADLSASDTSVGDALAELDGGPCASGPVWRPIASDSIRRTEHVCFWVGGQMIVWGGRGAGYPAQGSRYDPTRDTWEPLSTVSAPLGRLGPATTLTSREMFLWGGVDSDGVSLDDGLLYDPTRDRWRRIEAQSGLAARELASAISFGDRVLLWGGHNSDGNLGDGAIFDVIAGSWTPMSMTDAPSPRHRHVAVRTQDDRMIVWGGTDDFGIVDDGASYDPETDTWEPLPEAGAPLRRTGVPAVWAPTTREVIVWGGPYPGARFDPQARRWVPMTTTNEPARRAFHSAVWTGREMVVFGGNNPARRDAHAYDPQSDTWRVLPDAPIAPRGGHCAVWTDDSMIVFGGQENDRDPWADGARLDCAQPLTPPPTP